MTEIEKVIKRIRKAINVITITSNGKSCRTCKLKHKCHNDMCGDADDLALEALREKLQCLENPSLNLEELKVENVKLKQQLDNSVVLPCRIGDKVTATVLRPYNGNTAIIKGEVIGILIEKDKETIIRVLYDRCRTIDFNDTDFGETVFLTKKAQQALREETK